MSAAYFFKVWEEAVTWASIHLGAPHIGSDLRDAILRRRTTASFATDVRTMGRVLARGAQALTDEGPL